LTLLENCAKNGGRIEALQTSDHQLKKSKESVMARLGVNREAAHAKDQRPDPGRIGLTHCLIARCRFAFPAAKLSRKKRVDRPELDYQRLELRQVLNAAPIA
jgi:hypothetical protein